MSIYNTNSLFQQLDLAQLKHFYAVATFGGFSKASRATGVSQPALSLGVQKLEKNLGVTLIDRDSRRDSRRLSLTNPGLSLLSFCQRLEGNLESIADALGPKAGSVRRRMRIGTAFSIGFSPLADLCVHASASGEPIDLELTAESSYKLMRQVAEGAIDAALLRGDVYDSLLTFTKIGKDRLAFVVDANLREQVRAASSNDWREGLAAIPLITYPFDTPMRAAVDKLRMRERLAFKTVHSVDGVDAIKTLLERGAGGAFVLRSLVSAELQAHRLYEVKLPLTLPTFGIVLATRTGEQGDAIAKKLKSLLGRGLES